MVIASPIADLESSKQAALERLGYDVFFRSAFAALGRQGLFPARVARTSRAWCWAWTEEGELRARVVGRLLHGGDVPVVGDFVALEWRGGDAVVTAVLPRRTRFVRRAAGRHGGEQVIAANIDVALLVMGLDGDFNPRRMERYLALAHESGARPIAILNKSDLCPDVSERVRAIAAVAGSVPIYPLSARLGDSVAALTRELSPGATFALLGSSGVGKSTLLNCLAGEERMATGAVRDHDDRGRHTTTHRQLVTLPSGALVIDNPGMRELGMVGDEAMLDDAFADVIAIASDCRFRDCSHSGEPGCAVAQALSEGRLAASRFESHEKLKQELGARRPARAAPSARPPRRRRER